MTPAPSLKALRAFETVSRHLSVSLAADELCVSQPAVSQQIKSLESCLGIRLVYRDGQGLALTDVGQKYAQKLQTVQVAILGLVLLGDKLSFGAVFAIAVSFVGVISISLAETKITVQNLGQSLFTKTTFIGLACGAALGASVIFFRGATLSLGGDGFLIQSAVALTVAVILQTLAMGIYIAIKEPTQIKALAIHWRPSLMVGISGALASIFWFTAFTVQNASYVRAVGQIELVFTLLASAIFFREKIRKKEIFGIICIISGILILLLV